MRIALFVLKLVIPRDFPYREELLDDLVEEFDKKRSELGQAGAKRWLWGQVLRSVAPLLRWRLERKIERLGPDALAVWAVWMSLFVYLCWAVYLPIDCIMHAIICPPLMLILIHSELRSAWYGIPLSNGVEVLVSPEAYDEILDLYRTSDGSDPWDHWDQCVLNILCKTRPNEWRFLLRSLGQGPMARGRRDNS